MNLDNVFKKTNALKIKKSSKKSVEKISKIEVPEGLLKKCNKCKKAIMTNEVIENSMICPKCGGYFRMDAYSRIKNITDDNTFEEWDRYIETTDPLKFKGYKDKLEKLKEQTDLVEAIVIGKAKICGMDTVIGVMDGRFMMSSMGMVVGEKITRAVERANVEKLPVIIFTCSGGARMQEGIVSLMQMAKTQAALKKHSENGLLYVSVLTDPTTGGVTASFAMQGDIILAEPKALIGFAGPRVIEQTIGQKLPSGFQSAEFLLEHGFIDAIVERKNMRTELGKILKMHSLENVNIENEYEYKSVKKIDKKDKIFDVWDRVMSSRKNNRPVGSDYINALFTDFMEFHGDRCFKDDPAVVGGIASFMGKTVTVIALQKGKDTFDNIKRNFGMSSPEGYRKSLRLMKQAEKFNRPVICFVDTPGAFCGIEAEERGQGQAIANNIFELSGLKVPTVSIIIGEGGSGGALALAVTNEVWMLENSIYSILSPEGFASILWKDSKKAKEASKVMKLTAADLHEMGIVEKVFDEPSNFIEDNMEMVTDNIKNELFNFIKAHENMSSKDIVEERYNRFRKM